MAPSLPSCISSTFCSHRQASWFLLATLTPFFLPFLILSLPFLLLFLAPVSCFLFFLLLLYKVQVSVRSKRLRSHRRADKAVLDEGYQETQQIAAAERLNIHHEEDRGGRRNGVFPAFEGLEDSNVHSAESHTHLKGDTEGSCIPPSSFRGFEEEKREAIEEELAAQGGMTEDKIEEKQEDQDIIEGPLLDEDRDERIGGDFPEDEGPEVSNVQNVESPASYKAGVEEGLQAPVSHSPERESDFTEETREDMGEELLRNDMMEDSKQEEEDITEEAINFKDEQKHFPLCVDATSSRTLGEENWALLPPTYERESLNAPHSYDHQSSVPFERQGQESLGDRNERLESSHMHPLEEAWRELPAIQIAEPDFQAKTAVFPTPIVEKPWEDALDEQLEIDTPFTQIETQEPIGEEPERSSEKDLSLENLVYKGMPDQKEDVFFPAVSFEREIEEGEPSCSSPEDPGQRRKEAFAKETRDDVQPQKDEPAKNLAVSFEAESPAEREGGYPSEATSSAVPPPHLSHGGIEFQDRMPEEQKIMADINAIKKIVGYLGEPHASITEQISALYMFLGMEPYDWAAEIDNFERVQAEIELLKVVVGVK